MLGYSIPVDAVVDLDELREHVFTHADDPDLIPYRTSYWKEQWGFCMSRRQLESLEDGDYHVVIDASLENGSLTSGEVNLPGATDAEFLLTTHVCHPALANDNLSGVVLLWALARTLAQQQLRHTYPTALEPRHARAPLLARPQPQDARPREARSRRVVRRRPGPAPLQAEPARCRARSTAPPTHVLARDAGDDRHRLAADGRRRAPVLLTGLRPARRRRSRARRTASSREYHSSADDLELVTPESLAASYQAALEIIDVVETNKRYRNASPYGEPQLGRRGLYQSVPDGTNPELAYLWVLNLSDGHNDLFAIAERSDLPFERIRAAA